MSLPVTGADYVTTQIVASTDQTVTTLLVASPTEPFPLFDATHTYFYLTIVDEPSYIIDADPPTQREIVKVYDYAVVATGYELTCVRGSAGTNAQIWAVGAVAEIRPCAQWFEDVKGGGGGGDVTSVSSTDVAITIAPTIGDVLVNGNDFVGSGVGHAHGLVPDPGAVAGTDNYLREDGTWATPPGGGGGAPVDATYVTMSLNGTLTQERVLTAGTNVTITDNGANGTVVISSTGGGNTQSAEFTTTTVFTPGAGVEAVWITMIGGGGGGSSVTGAAGGGGGGSGELVQNMQVAVSGPVTVTIGAKGVGASSAGAGTDGGNTSFGSTYIAIGGKGGTAGGAGGDGGGVLGGTGGAATGPGTPGPLGTPEAPTYFGGGGGGGGSFNNLWSGGPGAGSGGYAGGAGGALVSSQGGGGGGASTLWGLGGAGGAGGSDGADASSTVYGSGGGGAGGKTVGSAAAGDGCAGYCLVVWIG